MLSNYTPYFNPQGQPRPQSESQPSLPVPAAVNPQRNRNRPWSPPIVPTPIVSRGQSRAVHQSQVKCHKCGQYGHKQRKCKLWCTACRNHGHIQGDCFWPFWDTKCSKCKRSGHPETYCYDSPHGQPQVQCKACGQSGHVENCSVQQYRCSQCRRFEPVGVHCLHERQLSFHEYALREQESHVEWRERRLMEERKRQQEARDFTMNALDASSSMAMAVGERYQSESTHSAVKGPSAQQHGETPPMSPGNRSTASVRPNGNTNSSVHFEQTPPPTPRPLHIQFGSFDDSPPAKPTASMRGGKVRKRADSSYASPAPVEREDNYVEYLTLKSLVEASEPDFTDVLKNS
jgi:hypothetical protein